MPVRVFLSSKMKEFDNERAAIVNQIAAMHGFQVNAAEEWGACSNSPQKYYIGGVRECHIYMGLFGRAYSPATREEYDAACENPYRQKLIYIKQSRNIDPKLAELIQLFRCRHRPYTFRNLWDLLPRVQSSLDFSLEEILNQHLELHAAPPVAQGDEASIAMEAWKNSRRYLTTLYRTDDDLTPASIGTIRRSVEKQSRKLRLRFGRVLSPFMGS